MEYVNMHDAKTHLSKYIEQVLTLHQEIVICRNGRPVARLTEYTRPKKRKLGLLKGKIKIKDDFDELPKDFMEYFQ
ncbi:MAG: type II toxin-antitoxin system Phd/YefM family antitoxin [Verrucomicrobia bacterium]|nr:type II toxin-antitoxin system Phd/YefM family antitoxin [Verrucomicrobiota bacterium]